jgi:signal transduction histidine kinase
MNTPQRSAASPQELRMDIWLAGVIFVSAVISAALTTVSGMFGAQADRLPWALVIAVAVSLPLAFRRRFPVSVMVVVCTAYFLAVTFKIPEIYAGNVSMFISIYTVGAWVNDRRRAFIARVLMIVAMFVWLLITMFIAATDPDPQIDESLSRAGVFSPFVAYMLIQLLINVGFYGGAYYLGDRAFRSALEREALDQRQRELEHEREVTAAQAVALDRVNIARELHDVVAHHVSAMGVQAGAARAVMSMNPDAAGEALRGIEASARSAIDELHGLLETLRAPGDAGAPADVAPSTLRVERIPDLVARAVEVGMPTRFTEVGLARELPDITHANLYRIAQEALTNARRHGGPHAEADVRLRWDAEAVELEVANSGRDARASRAGLGQLGMRERASASGGTIEIGPRPRGGFLVRVRVPLTPGAA